MARQLPYYVRHFALHPITCVSIEFTNAVANHRRFRNTAKRFVDCVSSLTVFRARLISVIGKNKVTLSKLRKYEIQYITSTPKSVVLAYFAVD